VTLSQGKVVWKNGQLDVTRGAGRNVARPAMAPMFEAQSKWNELTRPQGVKRQPAVHQTP
jgi:dihydropyrimidinase